MGPSVSYLIAVLLLVLVNGEIYDNISKPFYDKSESLSPKPNERLSVMKEYVLYLTPDQVQSLLAAGAIVRPLPQINLFNQQQFQQSIQAHSVPHEQNIYSNEEFLDTNRNEFYKDLNGQQLNEAPIIKSLSTEKPLVKPRTKYKYSPKSHQVHASLYVPKRNNKTNTHSAEHVRYLPTYEMETLKRKPYSAEPLTGYFPVDTQKKTEVQSFLHSETEDILKATEILKHEEVTKSIKLESSEEVPETVLVPKNEEIKTPDDIHGILNIETPVEIQGQTEIQSPVVLQVQDQIQNPIGIENKEVPKLIEIEKLEEDQKSIEIQEQEDLHIPEEIEKNNETPEVYHSIMQIPTRTLTIERLQNQQPIKLSTTLGTDMGPVTFDDKTQNQGNDQESETVEASLQKSTLQVHETPAKIIPSAVVQRQYSSLLAPLLQHDKISESIAEQKDLIKNEREIQTKLQQIKESGTHNDEKYSIELDKLKKNLGKQNVLAEKLAIQGVSKKPQGLVKQELALQRLKSSSVFIPRPYPVSWGSGRPIRVPVVRPEQVEDAIPMGVNRHIKHEIPFAYGTQEPEHLTILRGIWEQ